MEVYRLLWGNDIVYWDKFEEVARAVWKYQRVVVPSGHGVGKTFDSAHLALAFLLAWPNSKIITTAPTWYQVEKLLWSEIKAAYHTSKLPLGGRLLETQLKVDDNWFAIGLSPRADAGDQSFGVQRLQGFHAEHMLIILDEAPAIQRGVLTAAESLIVSPNNKLLMIGNPTSPEGPFYDACRSPLWHKIKISCFDHPNVKTGQIVVPGAVTREWVESRRIEWGEGSALWQAKVMGEFPAEGDDTLIPLTWAEAAIGREADSGSRRLSIDVARYGNDKTILYDMQGAQTIKIDEYTKRDLAFVQGAIIRKKQDAEYDYIIVDDTGLGGGVTDNLEDMGHEVEPFIAAAKPREPENFAMVRDEAYWVLRECFKPDSKTPISIPNDQELINQLTSIKFRYNRKGQIAIESKDEMKKRGLKSPDKADALAMNVYYMSQLDDDADAGVMIIRHDEDY